MKKYLAITAALALALTACGQAEADSTPTPTAATEATAAPAEQPLRTACIIRCSTTGKSTIPTRWVVR